MKRLYLILCVLVVISSCKKDEEEITFTGKVYYDCNNSEVISNASVTIHLISNSNGQHIPLSPTYTDNNGNYSVKSTVTDWQNQQVEIKVVAPSKGTRPEITDYFFPASGKSQMDCIIKPNKNYALHIKNTNPFDNNDVLNSLLITYGEDDLAIDDTVITNLTGSNVDTIIYFGHAATFSTFANFTKNNISHHSLLNQNTHNSDCEDTLAVDVFY